MPSMKRRYSIRNSGLSFNLRLLLIFVAIGYVWFGIIARQARDQREAVAEIIKSDGRVGYDFQYDKFGNFDPDATPSVPMWFCDLMGVDLVASVESVRFGSADMNDFQWQHLLGLRRLKRLDLNASSVTDAEMKSIGQLESVEVLSLGGTRVIHVGLQNLKGLAKLRLLEVPDPLTEEHLTLLTRQLPNTSITK